MHATQPSPNYDTVPFYRGTDVQELSLPGDREWLNILRGIGAPVTHEAIEAANVNIADSLLQGRERAGLAHSASSDRLSAYGHLALQMSESLVHGCIANPTTKVVPSPLSLIQNTRQLHKHLQDDLRHVAERQPGFLFSPVEKIKNRLQLMEENGIDIRGVLLTRPTVLSNPRLAKPSVFLSLVSQPNPKQEELKRQETRIQAAHPKPVSTPLVSTPDLPAESFGIHNDGSEVILEIGKLFHYDQTEIVAKIPELGTMTESQIMMLDEEIESRMSTELDALRMRDIARIAQRIAAE